VTMLRRLALLALLPMTFASPVLAKGKPTPKSAKVDTKDIPGTVKWFCAQYENAFTDARLKSCSAKERQAQPALWFVTTAAHNQQQCLEIINSALGQKRQQFRQAEAKICITAQQAFARAPDAAHRLAAKLACSSVVAGLRATGESCESPLDCAAGLSCVGPKGAPPGSCVPPLAEGENCDTDVFGASSFMTFMQGERRLCAAGLHCASAPGAAMACVRDSAPAKAPAARQAAGGACVDDGDCKGLCKAGVCAAVCGSG
jgi:hypothetical protein